jgi:hypothetical protein
MPSSEAMGSPVNHHVASTVSKIFGRPVYELGRMSAVVNLHCHRRSLTLPLAVEKGFNCCSLEGTIEARKSRLGLEAA